MKEPILLLGGGGHCKSCIDVIEQEDRFTIAGIVDVAEKLGQKVLNYTIIGTDKDLPDLIADFSNILITLGQIRSSQKRQSLFNEAKKHKARFPVVISPLAYVSAHARVAEGTIVMHHAVINAAARVGKNCIVNTKALIEHDAVIGDHCHISTGAIVNGGVDVGEGTFWGSGAVSKEYTRVSPQDFIYANSLVKGSP